MCVLNGEYKEGKWSLLIFLWREIGFFNDDWVNYHFKENVFKKNKSEQTPSPITNKKL